MDIKEKAEKLRDWCEINHDLYCGFCPLHPCPLEAWEAFGELTQERIKVIEDSYNKVFDDTGKVRPEMALETDITKMSNEQLLIQYKEDCFKDMESAEKEILKRMKSV